MVENFNYEAAMQRLEEIVGLLESGEESLESSMKLFEEGAKLSALCHKTLNEAEQKITELTKKTQEGGTLDE